FSCGNGMNVSSRDLQAIQNTIDLQCEMRRQLQCKALREPEKSRRRRNKASNGKNNAARAIETIENRGAPSRKMKSAREVDLWAQGNETRISLSQSLAVRASAAKRFPHYSTRAHVGCAALSSPALRRDGVGDRDGAAGDVGVHALDHAAV